MASSASSDDDGIPSSPLKRALRREATRGNDDSSTSSTEYESPLQPPSRPAIPFLRINASIAQLTEQPRAHTAPLGREMSMPACPECHRVECVVPYHFEGAYYCYNTRTTNMNLRCGTVFTATTTYKIQFCGACKPGGVLRMEGRHGLGLGLACDTCGNFYPSNDRKAVYKRRRDKAKKGTAPLS